MFVWHTFMCSPFSENTSEKRTGFEVRSQVAKLRPAICSIDFHMSAHCNCLLNSTFWNKILFLFPNLFMIPKLSFID